MSICCVPCWGNLLFRRLPRIVWAIMRVWWDVRRGHLVLPHRPPDGDLSALLVVIRRYDPVLMYAPPCYCVGDDRGRL